MEANQLLSITQTRTISDYYNQSGASQVLYQGIEEEYTRAVKKDFTVLFSDSCRRIFHIFAYH